MSETRFRFDPSGTEWREHARCKGMGRAGLDIFFPNRGESKKAGKALCARCPVAAECHEYAERKGETYGIWGGHIRHRGPE